MQTCLYRADIWLILGIAAYVAGLFMKKMFGNNEYRASIQKVCRVDNGNCYCFNDWIFLKL